MLHRHLPGTLCGFLSSIEGQGSYSVRAVNSMVAVSRTVVLKRGETAGCFSRMIIGALILVYASDPLVGAESRAEVATSRNDEVLRQTIEANLNSVSAADNGRSIHLTGIFSAAVPPTDGAFSVSGKDILRIRRRVEMYQWKEEQSTDQQVDKSGSAPLVRYSYHLIWSDSWICSCTFRHPQGHINPVMPMKSMIYDSPSVMLGAYHVNPDLLDEISDFQPFPVKKMPSMPRYPYPFYPARPLQIANGGFYVGWHPSDPHIGDVRISFEAVPSQVFSLIAIQSGDMLIPIRGAHRKPLVEPGVVSAASLLAE